MTETIGRVQFRGLDQAEALEPIWEITATELKEKLENGNNAVLLDVREPNEREISQLKGALLIPESDLRACLNELDSSDEIVVYCLGGVRSARAVNLLRDAGFRRLKNLRGGMSGWAGEPSLSQYLGE